MNQLRPSPSAEVNAARIASERQSQHVVTAFVVSGILFMLLPGTFLGVWNLLGISQAHQPSSIPQAWLQAHGQAQIFGWIGSFIIGIGFYSLTKMKSSRGFPTLSAWSAWSLWTSGVLVRWLAGVTGDEWRILFPLSGALQLFGYLFFFTAVRSHRSTGASKPEVWMRLVFAATVAFLVTLIVNCSILLWQALHADSPALPHVPDQQFVVLAVWGILVPAIWGFNARWLSIFAGLEQPNALSLYLAYGLSIVGVATTFFQLLPIAEVAFLFAALLAAEGLNVWKRSVNPPKLINVHRSFAWFVRLTYVWLLISCILAMLEFIWDTSGGLWGASRHALTVGFVAGMVFAIGQRVLPAFCGMRVLWSKQLMFWSLVLLFGGCALRVLSEPLAYGNRWPFAWKILPVSAVTELAAVSLFALNIIVTLLRPPAHLRVPPATQ